MATKAQSAEGPESRETGGEGVRRRDFLNVAAVSFAGVGAVAAIAPLLVQMSPSADVLALATTEVDISKVQPGQGITKIALTVEGSVPGIEAAAFEEAAQTAKENCPVSKVLNGRTDVAPATVEATMGRFGIPRLIHGHTHRPKVHDEKHGTRIVLGDWYEQGSVLRVDRDGAKLSALG